MPGSAFSDRTVLVTGASRGIGLATAERFHAQGARVALLARDRQLLKEAVARLGDRAHAVAADVGDPGECARAVEEVEATLGPIDVLVSCAGILKRDWIEDIKVEQWDQTWRTNVSGSLWLCQRVLPGMRSRKYGRIVLVSSELGLIGGPSYGSYCASKWALVGLAEVLAHELKGSEVRVCAACPGDVRTEQLAEEHAWGSTGGSALEKAMSPEYAARAIVKAAAGHSAVVVIDKPQMRLAFDFLSAMPRRLRLVFVGDAFKGLTRSRAL
ncbi:MAG TPA: SDR family oxidoreductase [Solirubrobacteraceae bacterium]|nr:SDR family oxidoreductase [Solirubrobacteraceae bacterium]